TGEEVHGERSARAGSRHVIGDALHGRTVAAQDAARVPVCRERTGGVGGVVSLHGLEQLWRHTTEFYPDVRERFRAHLGVLPIWNSNVDALRSRSRRSTVIVLQAEEMRSISWMSTCASVQFRRGPDCPCVPSATTRKSDW